MVVIMVNNKCRNGNVDVRSLNCKSWHSMWINWTMKRSITAAIKHCNGGQQNLESLSAVMFSCDLAISSHCAAAVKLCLERKLILLFLMIERTTLFFVQNSLEYNFVTRYIVKAKTKSAFWSRTYKRITVEVRGYMGFYSAVDVWLIAWVILYEVVVFKFHKHNSV